MELPNWLNEHFLTEVLQEDNVEQVKVSNFSVKLAVPPGNNHLSQAFRIKVEYRVQECAEQTISLIVKAPNLMLFPENEPKTQDCSKRPPQEDSSNKPEQDDFFNKEPKFYLDLFPKMSSKMRYSFGPKFYSCSVKGALVLEDLGEDGFVMCDRFQQLDYQHCKEVLITLAKFHAVSVACHIENPHLIESLGCDMDYSKNEQMDNTMKTGVEHAAMKVAEITKGINIEFSNYILSKVDTLWESSKKMFKPQQGALNVLNHGDLWTTNILFKYSGNGQIEKVKLIDYQLLRYTSPALDVAFFIWTSGNNEVREKHHHDLYSFYLKTLNKTLEELGCDERLTKQEFLKYLRDVADNVLCIVCHVLAIFMADPEDGILKLHELDPEGPEDGMFHKLYKGKYYRSILPHIARQYLPWVSSLDSL